MGFKRVYAVNVVAQGASRVLTFGINFGVLVLVARLGGVQLFGEYSYIITFLGLFIALSDFGTNAALAKDLALVKESAGLYWGNFLILRVILSAIVILISIGVAYFVRRDMFVILALSSVFMPFLASRFFEPVFQIFNRPWFSLYSSLFYALSYLILSLVVFMVSKSLASLVAAYVCANIAYTVTTIVLARKFVKPIFVIDKATLKNILRISIPLGVSSFFAIINTRIGIFMLAKMKSDYEVAIYNAADRFVNPMTLISLMLIYPLLPIFSIKNNTDKELMRENFQKIIEYLAMVTFPIAILFPLFSPRIILITFGREFLASAGVLNIMIWFWIIVTYSLLSSAFLLAKGIVNIAYWNTATAVAISLALNYLMIPRHGFTGAALTAVAAEAFLAGVNLVYIAKHAGTIIVWKKWIKIIGANAFLFLYVGMMSRWHFLSSLLIALTSLLLYLLAINIFKMVSKKEFMSVLPGKIQRVIMARYPSE